MKKIHKEARYTSKSITISIAISILLILNSIVRGNRRGVQKERLYVNSIFGRIIPVFLSWDVYPIRDRHNLTQQLTTKPTSEGFHYEFPKTY